MGKLKRQKVDKKFKSIPFSNALEGSDQAKPSNRNRIRDRKDDDEQFVDDRLSKKILQQAKEQQDDLEEEFGLKRKHVKISGASPSSSSSFQFKKQLAASDDEDEELCEDENVDNDFYEDVQLAEEDEKALAVFMNPEAPVKRTLADIIMEKLTEKQTEIRTQLSDAGSLSVQDMDERVVAMYKGVGEVLSHYRSGKLPKAFKVIPALTNWEQVLYLTEPDKWSAAAMYQATRIFVSNLKEKMVQRFVHLVLFPRVRDDIAEFKKLNFHLYQALRKSLFKPGAFFKGIILPLCEARDSTLREAIILGSVMAKNSIPMFHSAAAMLKIAEMEYAGANSIFLRVLLDKKYALPYRVVDALVYHFLGFRNEKRELPVLWHQSLLTFVQRYKEDMSEEQKDSLKELLKIQCHQQITPEVRRELQHAVSRGSTKKEQTVDMKTDPVP